MSDKQSATASRRTILLRWLIAALIVAVPVVLVRRLPAEEGLRRLEEWVVAWGDWGPFLFGILYVAAVLLMLPGSAMTVAAGALFGLVRGVLVVSLASTTAAALGFLLSRYVARGWVARYVQRHPRFEALDHAIGEGGWKIVALLRLSPLVPFNVQNYVYGLTRIRFWPYVLASWPAMLPGTILYVYLGALGREGLQAVGGGRQRSPAEWALLLVGLLATLTVTLYVTRLARRALARRGSRFWIDGQETEGKEEKE